MSQAQTISEATTVIVGAAAGFGGPKSPVQSPRSQPVAMELRLKALLTKETLIELAIGIIIALAVVGVLRGNWPKVGAISALDGYTGVVQAPGVGPVPTTASQ